MPQAGSVRSQDTRQQLKKLWSEGLWPMEGREVRQDRAGSDGKSGWGLGRVRGRTGQGWRGWSLKCSQKTVLGACLLHGTGVTGPCFYLGHQPDSLRASALIGASC